MQIYQIFKTGIIWVTFRVAVVVDQMMLRFLQVRKRSASRHELPGLVRFFCWVMMMVFKGNRNFCILGAGKNTENQQFKSNFQLMLVLCWRCLMLWWTNWCGWNQWVDGEGVRFKLVIPAKQILFLHTGEGVPVVFSNGYTQLTFYRPPVVGGWWLVGWWLETCSCLLDFVWSHVFRGKVGNDSLVLVLFFQRASRFHRAVLMLLSTSMTLM